MNRKEKRKQGHYFWLTENAEKQIQAHMGQTGARSRSDFICDAVEFYCTELDSKTHQNVITTETARVIRDNIKNLENRLAFILFNVAGEQANLGLLLADRLLGMSDEDIRATRNDAYDMIRRRSGFISFNDAMDNARYDPESSN